MKPALLVPLTALVLTGCVRTVITDRDPPAREVGSGGRCDADAASRYVGQRATAESGGAILRATGASRFRWGPPDAIFTMDYREDRVNVMYDEMLAITEIRCG